MGAVKVFCTECKKHVWVKDYPFDEELRERLQPYKDEWAFERQQLESEISRLHAENRVLTQENQKWAKTLENTTPHPE